MIQYMNLSAQLLTMAANVIGQPRHIVMAYRVMVYIVHIVMAYIVMANIVMA